MEKIKVGKIVNTFGLKGELKVLLNQNVTLDEIYIAGFDEKFRCEKQVDTHKFVKIKFFGYDDINQVLQFVNRDIFVLNMQNEALSDDEYLVTDLVNSKIYLSEKELGKITGVENFGATDILVFECDGKEMRVPFIAEFFDLIDPKNKILKANEKIFEGVV